MQVDALANKTVGKLARPGGDDHLAGVLVLDDERPSGHQRPSTLGDEPRISSRSVSPPSARAICIVASSASTVRCQSARWASRRE